MTNCNHPPERLFSWFVYNYLTGKNDILCTGCCQCGEVLQGGAILESNEESDMTDVYATTFVPDYVRPEDLLNGNYQPFVVLSYNKYALSREALGHRVKQWHGARDGGEGGWDPNDFALFLEDCGYIVPRLHENGIIVLNLKEEEGSDG